MTDEVVLQTVAEEVVSSNITKEQEKYMRIGLATYYEQMRF